MIDKNLLGKAFIEAGIPTITMLCSTIKRDETGKKLYGFTAPSGEITFSTKLFGALPVGWNSKSNKHQNFNKSTAPCMAALMGDVRGGTLNIVGIDCDNQPTFDYFRSLDPNHAYYFTSISKGGGTILYRYDPKNKALHSSTKAPQSSTIKDETGREVQVELDYLATNRLMFMPTEGNKTKSDPNWDLDTTVDIPYMPSTVQQSLIKVLGREPKSHPPVVDGTPPPTIATNHDLENNKKRIATINKMDALTMQYTGTHYIDYDDLQMARTALDFVNDNISEKDFCRFLFPPRKNKVTLQSFADIAEGQRHEIIIKNINYRLIWCRGIDNNNREKILKKICSFTTWTKEESRNEINGTITNEGSVCDDYIHYAKGVDPTKQFPLMCISPSGRYIEIYRDINFDCFISIDYAQNKFRILSNESQLTAEIKHNTTMKKNVKKIVDNFMAIGEFNSTETKKRGIGRTKGHETMNLYAQNYAETVASNPSEYAHIYKDKEPFYTLAIMETLFYDKKLRQYLHAFFRDLLILDESSAVVPLNEGIYGSGKTGFWEGVIGGGILKDKIAKFSVKDLKDARFNSDWVGKRLLISNEGLAYASKRFKNETAKKIHDLTGSHYINIEEKFKSKYTIRNFITFVLNCNFGENVYEHEYANRRDLPIFFPKGEFCNSGLVQSSIKAMGESEFAKKHNSDKDSVAMYIINKAKEEAPLYAYWLATNEDITYPAESGFNHAYKSEESIKKQGEREELTALIAKWWVNPSKYQQHMAEHISEAIAEIETNSNAHETYKYIEYLGVDVLFDHDKQDVINPNALIALIEIRGNNYEKKNICSLQGLARYLRTVGVSITPRRFRTHNNERVSRWWFLDQNNNLRNCTEIKRNLQIAVNEYAVDDDAKTSILVDEHSTEQEADNTTHKIDKISPNIQNRPPPRNIEEIIW